MISQRPKVSKSYPQTNNNKNSKPFSLFSNILSKTNQRKSFHRQSNEHMKHKYQKTDKENHCSVNIINKVNSKEEQKKYEHIQWNNNQANILQNKGNNLQNTILNQLGDKQEHIFDDSVIFKSEKIVLDNITNQIIEQSLEKPLFNQKNKYFHDQCSQENSFQELKDKKMCIDLKKKIKKLPKNIRLPLKLSFSDQIQLENQLQIQFFDQRQLISLKHRELLAYPYRDIQVLVDNPIYQNKLISQRIDNDVDTDEEQVVSGMNRMQKSLQQAVNLNKMTDMQMRYLH